MGRVKDTYIKFAEAGDEFAGRSLCMANILTTDFAQSPPMWKPTSTASMLSQEGLDELCDVQFKGFDGLLTEIIFLRMALKGRVARVVGRVPSGRS